MRVEQTYYGDYLVTDELPFSTKDLINASWKIVDTYKVNVHAWPVNIDYNEKSGFWEAFFGRPVSDEEYVSFAEDNNIDFTDFND